MTTKEARFQAEITGIRHLGDKYILVSASPKTEYLYEAGQYCFAYFQDQQGEFSRPYSIASAPHQEQIEFCWLASGDPRLNQYMSQLKIGQDITISAAAGKFKRPDNKRNAIFIAGGSGITPLRSMILDSRSGPAAATSVLLYGCESSELVPYAEDFVDLEKKVEGFSAHFYYAAGKRDNDNGHPGYPTKDLPIYCRMENDFFLCGPKPLMEASIEILKAHQIPDEQIFVDQY